MTFEALVDDALALAGFLEEIATRALACAVSPVARGVSPVARGVAITDGLQQRQKKWLGFQSPDSVEKFLLMKQFIMNQRTTVQKTSADTYVF